MATLDNLVKSNPGYENIDEVHFRRGELLFTENNLSEAEKAYQQVITYGEASAYYERSLYKRGWTLFKQNRIDEGIEEFVRLFDLKFPGAKEGYFELQEKSLTDQELIADALRAVSLSLSYIGGADQVPQYFTGENARNYEDLVYGSLAAHYFEKGRYVDSALAGLEFVRQHPESAQAALFQHRAITAYQEAGFADDVLKGKRDYIDLYEAGYAAWNFEGNDDLEIQVTVFFEDYLIELAQYSHTLAQAEKNTVQRAELYEEAITLYEKYLNYFEQNDNSPEMRFLMAEALFESGRFQESTIQYEKVAYETESEFDKASVAGYAALLAYDKHQELLPPLPTREELIKAKEEGATEAPSVSWKRLAIDSSLRFFDRYSMHESANIVLTRAANDLFSLGELESAISVATRLVSLQPPAAQDLRLSAWSVIAHSEFELEDYVSSENAYTQVLALLPQNDSKYKETRELIAASIYKQGDIARKAGDTQLAVNNFLRIANTVPGSDVQVGAEYDAATVLLDVEDWVGAIGVLLSFRNKYPDNELQSNVTQNLAVAYLESEKPLDAAGEFRRLSDESDDLQVKREALYQSAELYEQENVPSKAAETYSYYLELYREPFIEIVEVQQKMIDLSLGSKNTAAADEWRQKLIDYEANGGAQRNERSKYLAANAVLDLAEPQILAYKSMNLTVPLDVSFQAKRDQMQVALGLLSNAAAYGVESVSTASTYHTAELYRSLSESLLTSERPEGLSELEAEEYTLLLEDQAYPLEDQAIEIHEINIARMPNGIYDEWVRESLKTLASLLPVRYNKEEQSEKYVKSVQ